MSNLTSNQIKDTYGGLLNIGPSGGTGATLRQVTDGFGNALPLQISDDTVSFTGNVLGGVTGPTGPQGEIGPTGPQGLKGDTGDTGATGPTGSDAPLYLTISATAGNVTLGLSDTNSLIQATGTTTFTIPADATTDFPTGTQIAFVRATTSEVGITGAAGVTLTSVLSNRQLAYQNSAASVIKTGADNWFLVGDLKE